jgi:4-carboxymuconolactone decarboxylase
MIDSQARREERVVLRAALTVGVTPLEIKEILYPAIPYVGMAKVFDFIHATNEIPHRARCPMKGLLNSSM